ncbi:MAG: L-ribulose-5-phosphate 4-epimerase AraD [Phycisphaeraceae bacterium]|nr:MAG: L-ribulose-5-phosphate 4-epimerase AraD [Phycisphaeraceae bacterium]
MPDLRQAVCDANKALVEHGLVTLTWGNVSGIDRASGLVAIKPSGVAYDEMGLEHMVLVDLEGQVVEGDLRPSSDTPTHVALYRAFETVGGVTHTHSTHATVLSQCRVELPCLGTTHADHFMGTVPVTRQLTADEVAEAYEANTGRVIIERFTAADFPIEPAEVPAVLVAGHAPFCWGRSAAESVKNAVALEACARMAVLSGVLTGDPTRLEPHVLKKHHDRKHGPGAYYGQKK